MGSQLHASLLEEMGIDSEASRMVREQDYASKNSKAPPAQHFGAEGLPPLPLPVVPQRRTEKKNPEHPPYRLETDHPLYRAYYEVTEIGYRPLALKAGARNGIPSVIGIDINTRTAVFFRYDLSTAWDKSPSDQMHIIGYEYDTARELGANLAAYITAQRSTAMPLSRAMQFVDVDEGRAGKLAIAQVQYSGLWKTRDTSLSMLLNVFHSQTNTPVRFEKKGLPLDSSRIFNHPLLYMTGTISFSLTDRERENLRTFLKRGGVLLAEATGGAAKFCQIIPERSRQDFAGRNVSETTDAPPDFSIPECAGKGYAAAGIGPKAGSRKQDSTIASGGKRWGISWHSICTAHAFAIEGKSSNKLIFDAVKVVDKEHMR